MELSEPVKAFLAERCFAVLATIGDDGLPQQTVMWYELGDGYVLMNTARNRIKDKHLQRDPRASVCVEDGYRYITIIGSVTLDDDPARAQADIARLALRYEGERADRMIANFRKQQRVTIYLHIENVVASGFDS